MSAVLPFAGFYNSVHSQALDYAYDQLIQDSNGSPVDGLASRGDFSFTAPMLNAYGKLYVARFSEMFGVKCEFSEIDSPREYNFETDRIFVRIEEEELQRIYEATHKGTLLSIAERRHTSRSGFISYYSPRVDTWGPVDTWEPEQLHTLLLAYIDGTDAYDENDCLERGIDWPLMEDCDEEVYTLVGNNLDERAERIANIACYLRERSERKYRNRRSAA